MYTGGTTTGVVDVRVASFAHADTVGNVSSLVDRRIGKTVRKITGSSCSVSANGGLVTSGASFVSFWRRGSNRDSLGNGQFCYVLCRSLAPLPWAIEVNVRVKSHSATGTSLQFLFCSKSKANTTQCLSNDLYVICLPQLGTMWSVIAFNLSNLVSTYTHGRREYRSLQKITLFASLMVWTVFTSDVELTLETLPLEMHYPLETGISNTSWRASYLWVNVPETVGNGSTQTIGPPELEKPTSGSTNTDDTDLDEAELSSYIDNSLDAPDSPGVPSKHKESLKKATLSPQPIIQFQKILGCNVGVKVSFTSDGSNIVFPANNMIIKMHVRTGTQISLQAHSYPVCQIANCDNSSLMVSADQGNPPIIILWNIETGTALCEIRTQYRKVLQLGLSRDGEMLAAVAASPSGRKVLSLFDTRNVSSCGNIGIIATHSHNYNVNCIMFLPGNKARLVECGSGIRFWRAKGNSLHSIPVVLGDYSLREFTSVSFSSESSLSTGLQLYASTTSGEVLQIDCNNVHSGGMCVKQIFELQLGPILSLSVSVDRCIIGSKNGSVSVFFLLDLPELISSFGSVSSVDVSRDGLSIVGCTSSGQIALVSLSSPFQQTVLLRSHMHNVTAMAVDPFFNEVTTISQCDVRVWDLSTAQQLYHFDIGTDVGLCISYHKKQRHVVACGFESGVIRILDISQTCEVYKLDCHKYPVTVIAYSCFWVNDKNKSHTTSSMSSERLVSWSTDGLLVLSDPSNDYQGLSVINTAAPAGFKYGMSLSLDGTLLAHLCESPQTSETQSLEVVVLDIHELSTVARVPLGTIPLTGSEMPQGVGLLKFTPDSTEIIIHHKGQLTRVNVFDRRSQTMAVPLCSSFSVSTNSQYLAVCCSGIDENAGVLSPCEINIFLHSDWSLPPQKFIGHCFCASDCTFTPTGKNFLVSCGNSVLLWEFCGSVDFFKDDLPEYPKNPPPPEGVKTTNKSSRSLPVLESTSFVDISTLQLRDPSKATLPVNQAQLPPCHKTATLPHDSLSEKRFISPGGEALTLLSVNGFNLDKDCIFWSSTVGVLVYAVGCTLVVLNLHSFNVSRGTGSQKLLLGHTEAITVVAGVKSGVVVASGCGCTSKSGRSQIRTWDTTTGACQHVLCYHRSPIQALSFCPDSALLVSVGTWEDSIIAVWDYTTGNLLATCASNVAMHSVAFSQNWKGTAGCFVTGGCGAVFFWSLDSSSQLHVNDISLPSSSTNPLLLHATAIVSPLPNLVISGLSDGSVLLWDVASKTQVGSPWQPSGSEIRQISCDGHTLIASSGSPYLHLSQDFFSNSRTTVSLRLGCTQNIVSMVWNETLKKAILTTDDGCVWLTTRNMDDDNYDGTSNQDAILSSDLLITSHIGTILHLSYVSSLGLILSSSDDGTLKTWTLDPFRQTFTYTPPTPSRCTCNSFHPSDQQLCGGYDDGYIEFRHIANVRCHRKCKVFTDSIHALCYIFNGTAILVSSSFPFLRIIPAPPAPPQPVGVLRVNPPPTSPSYIHQCPINSSLILVSYLANEGDGSACAVQVLQCLTEKWDGALPSVKNRLLIPLATSVKLPPIAQFFYSETTIVVAVGEVMQVHNISQPKSTLIKTISLGFTPTSLALLPSQIVALGTPDRLLRLISLETGASQDMVVHSPCSIRSLVAIPQQPNKGFLVGACANSIHVWRIGGV
ncbi:WD repeat domain 90 [Pelomyxa schiedti]|nr:WD repeat domain 90 [Pelomyxa schiedti]